MDEPQLRVLFNQLVGIGYGTDFINKEDLYQMAEYLNLIIDCWYEDKKKVKK